MLPPALSRRGRAPDLRSIGRGPGIPGPLPFARVPALRYARAALRPGGRAAGRAPRAAGCARVPPERRRGPGLPGPLRQRACKPDPVWRDHPSPRDLGPRGDRVRRGPAAYLDLAGPGRRSCLALPRVGFARPPRRRGAGALLPHHFTFACARSEEGAIGRMFLWHFPAGFPGWALPTTLALRCPDFPRGVTSPRSRGSRMTIIDRRHGDGEPRSPPPADSAPDPGSAQTRATARAAGRLEPLRRADGAGGRAGRDEPVEGLKHGLLERPPPRSGDPAARRAAGAAARPSPRPARGAPALPRCSGSHPITPF